VFVLQPYCTSITGVDGSRQTNGGVDREREREREREKQAATQRYKDIDRQKQAETSG